MNVPRDPFIARLLTAGTILLFLIAAAYMNAVAPAGDFRAFYCAGNAISAHGDPYRMEPLRTCELKNGQDNFFLPRGGVLPAPLPGYALAPFAALSRLPYAQARLLIQILIWSAVAAGILALGRLTGLPLPITAAAMLFSEGYTSAITGNIAAFSCTALIFSMLWVSRRRHALAAAGLTFALCEPHVACASVIASFLYLPALRLPIVCGLTSLLALSYATIGLTQTLEYFREVLLRHAFAEVAHEQQYSLTGVLHFLGFSDRIALTGGMLSFALMLVIGIILGARLRDRFGEDAFLIAVPAACSLIGGTFLHYPQLAVAMPAALLLYTYLPERRFALGWAIMLLATPWIAVIGVKYFIICLLANIGFLCWSLMPNQRSMLLAWFTQTGILLAGAQMFYLPKPPLNFHVVLPPTAFSQDAWRIVTDTLLSQRTTFYTFLKIPTWCGLGIILWEILSEHFSQRYPGGQHPAGERGRQGDAARPVVGERIL